MRFADWNQSRGFIRWQSTLFKLRVLLMPRKGDTLRLSEDRFATVTEVIWCNVVFNGEKVAWDEPMNFPVISIVLFPRGNRVTIW